MPERTADSKLFVELNGSKSDARSRVMNGLVPANTVLRRIRQRVRKGGHDVPEADVRRRFSRSLRYFVKNYVPLAHRWAVWDNQTSPPRLLADSRTCSQDDLRRVRWPE